ncbi:MAG: TPM domain-containing protein [Deltaproteobacteria bacterium]|nr:TPM domain-containing protein [Deltaproteobacteria bacterium]
MTFRLPWIHTLFSLILVAGVLAPGAPGAAVVGDRPASYVVDGAGIIDAAARQTLSGVLQELEQKTGAQMIVLTVGSTDGIPIEQFALDRAEKWKLGQKGKDNGLLLVIAAKDRKYRIEVGYGLEQTLPDSLAGSIARMYLVPAFKAGNYTRGIVDTTSVIALTIAKAQGVQLSGVPEVKAPQRRSRGFPAGALLALFFIATLFSSLSRSRSGGLIQAILLGSLLGGSGRGSSGGFGSFGGGGFGSFGGGGGGGFGGGGSSGGW